jgi:hypothetical protein
MSIKGIVQRWTQGRNGPNTPIELALTALGSLRVASLEGPYTELARAGRMFHGGTQIIANGIAPVQAIPTTTATLALVNTDQAGGRSLVIDQLLPFLGSGTPAAGLTLFLTIAAIAAANVPAIGASQPTGYGVAPTRGLSTVSRAVWVTALTLVGNPVWSAVVGGYQAAAANVGQSDQPLEVRGALIVPPQYALGIAILSGAGTTPLYGIGGRWGELELDLE